MNPPEIYPYPPYGEHFPVNPWGSPSYNRKGKPLIHNGQKPRS